MSNKFIVYDGRMSSPDEDTRDRATVFGFADSIKEGRELIEGTPYDGCICTYELNSKNEIVNEKVVLHYAPKGCKTWKAHQAMAGLKP